MATSHSNQLNEIIQIVELLEPQSVLDVGIGNGKYGFLLREYLGNNKGLKKEEFIIDGIEGFEDYITSVHRQIYNEIYIFDLREHIDLPGKQYDLCILIDVIEHFDRKTGLAIINYLSSISKYILITTPWNIGDLSKKHENPLQDHVYQWKRKDFNRCENASFIYNTNSLIMLSGQDRKKIRFVKTKMTHRLFTTAYDYIRRSIGIKRG